MKKHGDNMFQSEAASDYVDQAIIALHARELDIKELEFLFGKAKLSSENLMKCILTAREEESYKDMIAFAHTLGGLTANYGLVRLAALVAELKMLCAGPNIEPLLLDNCLENIQAAHIETFKAVAHLFPSLSDS